MRTRRLALGAAAIRCMAFSWDLSACLAAAGDDGQQLRLVVMLSSGGGCRPLEARIFCCPAQGCMVEAGLWQNCGSLCVHTPLPSCTTM